MNRRVASAAFRSGAMLACVLALSTGAEAQAQDSTSPPEAEASGDASNKLGLGVMLDVGAPDGVGLSAVVRPVRWLRINAGLTTNTLSLGLRGGISLVPLSSFVSPSLNLDLGHYFDANYNELVDRFGGIPLRSSVPINDVGFNYGGASVGLEMGKPERFSFSLRVGLAHGSLTIDDAERLLQDVTGDPDITAKPLAFRFTTPSVKLGFLLYFF
ncbi:autotransporter outer membrane beta-barrel domain-containing protein [Hyalangium sp.]|uniref:autotransporter outer membrane beta-barrel domain-containing protein n=1 Tax=Hyalangium sp. TaxID=2028555 RepID=UPI002D746D62|nr:autotransporter outer membrane beta-barrel domain-containing protein [Hyalangium sp.]HYH96795.1 autotransporter outer membrane beta-barrel domain-containing protein [Hyalangium sp.]